MPRSRFTGFVILTVVGLATLFLLSGSSRQVASDALQGAADVPQAVKDKLSEYDLLSLRVTFHKSAHKPPVQANSTNGDASWYSDWRWLNPFSSSVTWDQDRVVLPPLTLRPYVYTYYDTTTNSGAKRRTKEELKVEADLLQTWKRAWWAQGFRPVVLTQAEAMNHPLYPSMRAKGAQKVLELELERWLAWAHMGTGILASPYAFPMASYDDSLLKYLRHGEFDRLTRIDGLESGLFAGDKTQIHTAIEAALRDMKLSTYKTIIDAIPADLFKVVQTDAIAYYDTATINARYSRLSKQVLDEPVKGQQSLNQLINAHLQTIWQNTFKDGIRVLKPLPEHTTRLVDPAQHLALLLAECPTSILQSSCPPNKPRCSPCVASKTRIETKSSFENSSTVFTIATVPHPHTILLLNSPDSAPTVKYVRGTDRDTWIRQVTRNILGDGRGGPSRVIGLKSIVASEFSKSKSIWFTVERFPYNFDAPPAKDKTPTNDPHPEKEKIDPLPEDWLSDVDWILGFAIPRAAVSHGESYNPVPGQSGEIKGIPAERKGSYEPDDPTYNEALTEFERLKLSRQMMQSKDKSFHDMMGVAEAWNMADTEVWKFVRAYQARLLVERQQWEEEEAAYNGPGTSRGGRWF